MIEGAIHEAARLTARIFLVILVAFFIGGVVVGALLHSCATPAPARNAGEVGRG